MRPDVGTQAQFKKKKPPVTFRYDSSLSPALDWDGQNPAREQGEEQLLVISSQLSVLREKLVAQRSSSSPPRRAAAPPVEEPQGEKADPALQALAKAEEATAKLKALSKPFLNWAGKAERLSFDVPTLPLFVHERLSTKAIVDTLVSHKRDKQQTMLELFGDPQHSVTDQVLRAYEHRDKWVNRMVFPRTGAWESLKKALKGEYEESVWDHLAGTVSAPFEAGQQGQVAVKVIDDRGNELLVVEKLGGQG
jgi:adenine-specific DNA-methyltransferase